MSTESNKKRRLEEIYDDDDEFNDEVNDEQFDDDEPPLKKHKLSNQTFDDCLLDVDTNSNTNTNTNSMDKNTNPCANDNEAIILISGSISSEESNNFCINLKENNFEIMEEKEFEISEDELNHLFFECVDSSMNTVDIIECGMLDQFTNNKKNKAMRIQNSTNDIFEKLNIFSTSYRKTKLKKDIYFTLNNNDYVFKFTLLFFQDLQHDLFWDKLHKNHESFVGSNRSVQAETELNSFYDETRRNLEIERNSSNIKCCCKPIMRSLDPNDEKYNEEIEEKVINESAKECYQQAIERSVNIYGGQNEYISIQHGQMDIIWSFLGNVMSILKGKGNNSFYICKHCDNKIRLNPKQKKHVEKKKKKEKKEKVADSAISDKDKLCEICNKVVPNNENNWKQHINGKKHQKNAKRLKK